MSLLLILTIGAMLGWLVSIVTRGPSGHGLAANIGLGIAGALISGGMASGESLLDGISPASLGSTVVGAMMLLGVVNLVWRASAQDRAKAPPLIRP